MVLMAESLYDLKIPRKLLSDVYIDLSDRCDSLEDFSVEVAISRPRPNYKVCCMQEIFEALRLKLNDQ